MKLFFSKLLTLKPSSIIAILKGYKLAIVVCFKFIVKWYFYHWYLTIAAYTRMLLWLSNYSKKISCLKLYWIKFCHPNSYWALLVLSEIFIYDLLQELDWCDCVLDIWWYLWDTPIYLSKRNKYVHVYEPNRKNFSFLESNCKPYKNISIYNKAIWIQSKKINMIESHDWDCWSIVVSENSDKWIIMVNIAEVFKSTEFDWIKIDIEWWEYDLFKYFMKNPLDFQKLKKWFIEFHFFWWDEHKLFFDIVNRISSQGYLISLFDNQRCPIYIENIWNGHTLCNLIFQKKWKNSQL